MKNPFSWIGRLAKSVKEYRDDPGIADVQGPDGFKSTAIDPLQIEEQMNKPPKKVG